jgi:hypothetical protein
MKKKIKSEQAVLPNPCLEEEEEEEELRKLLYMVERDVCMIQTVAQENI